MQTLPATRVSSASKLDEFPITSFHRQIMWLLAFIFFCELGDLNAFAFAAPGIMKSWNLSISSISSIVSATFFGSFLGAGLGGWLSDSMGRKKTLVLTTAWFSAFSLAGAFVQGPIGLLVARLLTGMGLSAMTVVGIIYITEMFPSSKRGEYQGWIMTVGLVGIPATALVAKLAVPAAAWGWRLVFVWGSIGLLFPIFARRLEESPRWHEKRGNFDEAAAVVARIEARVHSEFGSTSAIPTVFYTAPSNTASIVSTGYKDLFVKPYLSVTTTLTVTWICLTLGFYGFMAWVPTLLVAQGFSLVNSLTWSSLMSVGAVPGALIAALISDRWQRKWLITIVSLAIAFCGLIYGMTFRTTLIMIFGFMVAMLLQTFVALTYSYTSECYPTHIRSVGSGFVYGISRLANVLGPLVIAFLFSHYGYRSVFLYIAAMWVTVAIAVGGFGPLTKGRTLE